MPVGNCWHPLCFKSYFI